jgi:head-tail adaptor
MRPRDRVTFQALTPISDGQGGRSTTPTALASDLPCTVEVLGREERLAAGQLAAVSTHRLRLRRRADVSPKHQAAVTYADSGASTTFQIQAIDRADDRGREMFVYCTAGQP